MVVGEKELAELTSDQQQLLKSFEGSHDLTTEIALKFLYARKFNRERVEELFSNYQEAVHKYGFESISAKDVEAELRTEKLYIPGTRDRNGAALFIVNAARHKPGEFAPEQTIKLAYYLGDLATSNIRTQKSGITLISNMEGVQWANFDSTFQRNVVDFFQKNIPARVKNILLYRAPWWISMLVKMITPFLSEKLRNRIRCLDDDSELVCYVEPDQLPTSLGGRFDYDHGAFVKHELDRAGIKAFNVQKIAAATTAMGLESAPPPGTIKLVSEEMSELLLKEREEALQTLETKIAHRRDSLKRHNAPLDLNKLILTRAARLSIDLGSIPTSQPNLLHGSIGKEPKERRGSESKRSARAQKASPISEIPNENYEREVLLKRVEESIRKDRSLALEAPGSVSFVEAHTIKEPTENKYEQPSDLPTTSLEDNFEGIKGAGDSQMFGRTIRKKAARLEVPRGR